MSEQLLKYGNWNLCMGLSWSVHESMGEARKAAKGSSGFVACPIEDRFALGVASNRANGKGRLHSAGLFLGLQFPSAIVVHDVEDGQSTWICALRDGIPLPDHDSFVPKSEARARVTDLSSWLDKPTLIGNIAGASMSLEDALEETQQAIARKDISGASVKSAELRRSTVNWKAFAVSLILSAGVAAVVIGGAIYSEELLNERKREQLLREMTMRDAEKQRLAAQRAAVLREFQSSVEESRHLFSSATVVPAQWAACENVRRKLPISHKGYEPTRLLCDYDLGSILIEWTPKGKYARVIDRTTFPGYVPSADPNALVTSKFDLPKAVRGHGQVAVVDPTLAQLVFADWGKTRVPSLRLNPPTAVVIGVPKLIADEPGVSPIEVGQMGEWTFALNGALELLMARAAVEFTAKYNTSLKSVTWTSPASASGSVQVRGDIRIPSAN